MAPRWMRCLRIHTPTPLWSKKQNLTGRRCCSLGNVSSVSPSRLCEIELKTGKVSAFEGLPLSRQMWYHRIISRRRVIPNYSVSSDPNLERRTQIEKHVDSLACNKWGINWKQRKRNSPATKSTKKWPGDCKKSSAEGSRSGRALLYLPFNHTPFSVPELILHSL